MLRRVWAIAAVIAAVSATQADASQQIRLQGKYSEVNGNTTLLPYGFDFTFTFDNGMLSQSDDLSGSTTIFQGRMTGNTAAGCSQCNVKAFASLIQGSAANPFRTLIKLYVDANSLDYADQAQFEFSLDNDTSIGRLPSAVAYEQASLTSAVFQRTGAVFSTNKIDLISVDGESPSITVVPEPTSWAMMVVGFGLVGSAMRRRTRIRFRRRRLYMS